VSAYRPSPAEPLVLNLGRWESGDGPAILVSLSIDPRVFAWLVNKAAARASGIYEIGLGRPPLTCAVVEV
jgi:hypothetical protein